jgi:hypothetical protein
MMVNKISLTKYDDWFRNFYGHHVQYFTITCKHRVPKFDMCGLINSVKDDGMNNFWLIADRIDPKGHVYSLSVNTTYRNLINM